MKKNIRKIGILVMAAVLGFSVLALSGCGKKTNETTAATAQTTKETVTETTSGSVSGDASGNSYGDVSGDASGNAMDPEIASQIAHYEEENAKIGVDNMVVIDEEQCYVEITGVKYQESGALNIELQIANRTDSTKMLFTAQDVYVDGNECDTMWAQEFEPGMEADTVVALFREAIDGGEAEFKKVEMTFVVIDYDNMSGDPIAEAKVELHPYGD